MFVIRSNFLLRKVDTSAKQFPTIRIEENGWRLRHASYLEKREPRSLHLDFEQFKKLSGTPSGFPYFRRIAAYSPESGSLQLEIELSDVEINVPKPFRFEIPAHYQRL